MAQSETKNAPEEILLEQQREQRWIDRAVFGTIRNKIIFPFLLLTMFIAMGGTFLVFRLIVSDVEGGFTSALIDATRAASNSVVLWEQQQLDKLRIGVFTFGIVSNIEANESATLASNLEALARNQEADIMIATDAQGRAVADVLRVGENYQLNGLAGQNLAVLPMIGPIIAAPAGDSQGDKYAGVMQIDDHLYLLTAAPVYNVNGGFVGTLSLGTRLDRILANIRQEVIVANLTFYRADGFPVETTFILTSEQDQQNIRIDPTYYAQIISDTGDKTLLNELSLEGVIYRTAFTPLSIRGDVIGVIGVSIPPNVVQDVVITQRNGLSIVFSLAAGLVVLVGYAVAQGLSRPILRLTHAAEEIRSGNLQASSGVRTPDEIGFLGVTFDAMTRRLSQQTLALEEAYQQVEQEAAFLSAVLTSAGDGIIVIAPDGAIERINPIALKLVQGHMAIWLDRLSELFGQATSQQVARQRVETQGLWYDAVATPILSQRGQTLGVIVVVRDITDQVLTERMRTAFVAQISHELKTPLTAIKGFVDLSKHMVMKSPEKVLEFLQTVSVNVEVLNNIVSQILNVTQMVRGELEIERMTMDLSPVLREVLSAAHNANTKDLRLSVRVDESLPLVGDQQRLKWAFSELVKNAYQYTLPGDSISISAQRAGEELEIVVADTGVGIAPGELPRIFEEFYRGFATARDGGLIDVRGAGVGLFVLRQIVEAHGGSVEVQSTQYQGSTFTVRLPAVPSLKDELESV